MSLGVDEISYKNSRDKKYRGGQKCKFLFSRFFPQKACCLSLSSLFLMSSTPSAEEETPEEEETTEEVAVVVVVRLSEL